MALYTNEETKPMNTRIVRIQKWVVYFVDAPEQYDEIFDNDKINNYWSKFSNNLVLKQIKNVLSLVRCAEDFAFEVLKEIGKDSRNHRGCDIAIVFDCKRFIEPKYFDEVVINRRSSKVNPYRYYCLNTDFNEAASKNMCETRCCISCKENTPSKCCHHCFEQLIEDLSS